MFNPFGNVLRFPDGRVIVKQPNGMWKDTTTGVQFHQNTAQDLFYSSMYHLDVSDGGRVKKARSGDGSTLNLDFTATTSLNSMFTFSRTTTATFINSSGLVQYADANLILQSESLATSPWTPTNGASVADVSTTNPIGGSTATQLTSGGANNSVLQAPSLAASVPHTVRFWVRGGTSTQMQFGYFAGSFQTASGVTVVGSGSVIGTGLMTITGLSTTTWTQVTFVLASPAASGSLLFYPDTASPTVGRTNFVWGVQMNAGSTASAYNRTTTSAYHSPRFDYDPTTLAPRGLLIEGSATNLIPYSFAMTGGQWEYAAGGTITVTLNTSETTAPDGTTGAIKILKNSGSNSYTFVRNSVTPTTSDYHTVSFWAKKPSINGSTYAGLRTTGAGFVPADATKSIVFDLVNGTVVTGLSGNQFYTNPTITPYRDGWYRISATSGATMASGLGSVYASICMTTPEDNGKENNTLPANTSMYVWGPMHEAGSGASSYIPTGAASGGAQRTSDNAYLTNWSAFSSNWNQYEGTLLIDGDVTRISSIQSYPRIVAFTTTTNTTPRFGVFMDTALNTYKGEVYLQTYLIDATVSITPGTRFVHAISALQDTTSRLRGSINGSTVTEVTDASPLGLTLVGGLAFNSGPNTNCPSVHLRRVKYWPRAFSQTELNSITTI